MSVNLYTEDGLVRIAGNGGGDSEEVQNKLLELEEKIKQLESANEETNQKIDSITKESLGLGNVDNTHDADKNVNSAKYLSPKRISEETDLNDLKELGNYYCNAISVARTLKNSPTTIAFGMVVFENTGITQEITEYITKTPKKYFRNYYDYEDIWSPWYRIYTEADPQTK